jgi:hypothetical protein
MHSARGAGIVAAEGGCSSDAPSAARFWRRVSACRLLLLECWAGSCRLQDSGPPTEQRLWTLLRYGLLRGSFSVTTMKIATNTAMDAAAVAPCQHESGRTMIANGVWRLDSSGSEAGFPANAGVQCAAPHQRSASR